MKQDGKFRCGATIDGPKVGARVVAWRKSCAMITGYPGKRCHNHRPPGCDCGLDPHNQFCSIVLTSKKETS